MRFFPWLKKSRLAASPRRPARARPRVEPLEDRCLLSGGVLDPTFGSSGVVNIAVNTTYLLGVATATYPNQGTANDGKIVTATVAFAGKKNSTPYLEVSRYNLNGTLDTTFGGTGEVMTFQGYARGVAVQPDGKIVVAGWETRGNFAAVRYNADGSLDTTFGSNGEAIVKFGRYGSYAYNVALQADGRIVLAGEAYDGSKWDVGLARLNTNGSLDTSFGAGGEVATPLSYSLNGPDYRWNVTNLAIDPNTSGSDPNSGKLIVGVQTQQPVGAVVRYNTNGTLDTAFGGGAGQVNLTTSYPAVAVQADDRVVVVGYNYPGVFLARLNADGTFDASFGSGGTVYTPPPPNGVVRGDSVALQANGQIVVGGMIGTNQWGLMAARWNTDGSLDTTFGTGGFAIAAGTGFGYAVALEPDGRIVVAGKNISSGGVELVRFLAAGPQIGFFTASPNPVAAGGSVTLTANVTALNPGSTITQVAFYVDSNGDGVLDAGDTRLVGTLTQSGSTWTFTFATTGWASGSYTLFAQAEDSYGVFSDPLALTLTVQ